MDKLPLADKHPDYDKNYVLSKQEIKAEESEKRRLKREAKHRQSVALTASLNAVTVAGKKASAFLNDGIFGAIVLFLLAISLFRLTNGLDLTKVSFGSFLNFVSGVKTLNPSNWKVIQFLDEVPEFLRFAVNPIKFIIYQVTIIFDCLNFILQFVIWVIV